MTRKARLLATVAGALLASAALLAAPPLPREVRRVAFGSCLKPKVPQAVWDGVAKARPDLFLFLGDAVYGGDSDATLRAAWTAFRLYPRLSRLRRTVPFLATWDDGELARNDCGADAPLRPAARRYFLDAFGEPAGSPRRSRPGVWDSRLIGPPGRRVHVILLDTRSARGPLRPKSSEGLPGRYEPDPGPSARLLGEEQWTWLAEELRRPAELRLLCSSIQLLADGHGFESWGLLPAERERLFALLRETAAAGVVVLSGDRHHGELSVGDAGLGYPLHDLTASGLNCARERPAGEPNRLREGPLVGKDHFGLVEVDWSRPDPLVSLQLRDVAGTALLRREVRLSGLAPRELYGPPAPAIAR